MGMRHLSRKSEDVSMPEWLREILAKPTATVPDAGRALGISRNAAYEAAVRGEIKTIRLGRRLVVPTAWLKSVLELTDQSSDGVSAKAA
jgi:hypothetical protein